MNYQQTLDYLFTRLPMFSRIGAAAIKKDLHNTIELCEALNNPHRKFKTIHVAGTNGKGSVSHMIAAILQTAGYKAGLYTSPHLHDFRERIKVNGEMISEEFVVGFTERIQPQIDLIHPSFFEITVAMAFDYFAQQKVDVAVVEVGLGGRLDSTNVITPELSIITNIGWDHMNLLGDSLEKIAGEKAGIIKPGIPVVVGEVANETETVFQAKANEQQAPLYIATDEYKIISKQQVDGYLFVETEDQQTKLLQIYQLDLPGIYQTKNILTVLAAIKQLQQKGWKISEQHIHAALKQVKKINGLHGRWEIVRYNPVVVIDVGHNVDGIKQIIAQLNETNYNKLHIITGMVKDKEVEKVLALLPTAAAYYFTQAHLPRALPAVELKQKAEPFGLKGEVYTDVNKALTIAFQYSAADDLILVCGSVFLAGEVDEEKVKTFAVSSVL